MWREEGGGGKEVRSVSLDQLGEGEEGKGGVGELLMVVVCVVVHGNRN